MGSSVTKHVFLSFVEEDLERVRLFRGQAKNKKSDLDFDDYSVKVPYNSENADYIKSKIGDKIRAASVTICLIGPQTSRSTWVQWEIEKANTLGKKVFGVRLYSDRTCATPSALAAIETPVYDWNIDAIVKAIG